MIVLTDRDEKRIRAQVAQPGPAADIYAVLLRRADRWTATPGVSTPGDVGGVLAWWHVVWERLTEVAFAQRLEPDDQRGQWLRNEVLDICDRPVDDWVGPFFRERTDPPRGMLETSHITLAVVTAASVCPDLFTDAEHAHIRDVVRTHGQQLCQRGFDRFAERRPTERGTSGGPSATRGTDHDLRNVFGTSHLNNWYMVLLNGFGTASTFLEDRAGIEEAIQRHAVAAELYEEDSYGESLQYWNYASNQLAHLHEVLVGHDPALAERLDLSCYTRCVPWAVHSLMYVKPLAGWGDGAYPRSLNFGDSTVMFRPSADLLLHIAARARDDHPTEAGLARWLFDTTFSDTELETVGGDTFGFFNHLRWTSLALLPDAAPALSPENAKLDLSAGFACGTVTVRDRWDDATTVLGMQAGHEPLKTASHRHADQNSFILAHRAERFIADPGHCCYRLAAQETSVATRSHTTWTFEPSDGDEIIEQRKPAAHADPVGRRTLFSERDGLTVVRADAAAAYGDPIERAERTWIAALPNVVFLIDRIEASEPVRACSHFVLNNRDNALRANVASDTRLVFRRGDAAMKLIQLAALSDDRPGAGPLARGWTYMHDVYHPEPNQPGQSREGAGLIYTFTAGLPATSHLAIYGIAMDAEPNIRSWHLTGDAETGFEIECGGEPHWRLNVGRDETLVLADVRRGVHYTIDGELGVSSTDTTVG